MKAQHKSQNTSETSGTSRQPPKGQSGQFHGGQLPPVVDTVTASAIILDAIHAAPKFMETFASSPLIVDTVGAAELIGISERSFQDLRREGRLPTPINVFGPLRPRWRKSDLIEWVNACPPMETALPEPERLSRGRARSKAGMAA